MPHIENSRWNIWSKFGENQHQKSYLELRYVFNITTIIIIITSLRMCVKCVVLWDRACIFCTLFLLVLFSSQTHTHTHIVAVRQIYANIYYNYQRCLRFMSRYCERKKNRELTICCHDSDIIIRQIIDSNAIYIYFKANCSARWWNLWQVTFIVYRPRFYMYFSSRIAFVVVAAGSGDAITSSYSFFSCSFDSSLSRSKHTHTHMRYMSYGHKHIDTHS